MTNSTGRVQARRIRLPGTIVLSRPHVPVHADTGSERNEPAKKNRILRSAPTGAGSGPGTEAGDALPADAA